MHPAHATFPGDLPARARSRLRPGLAAFALATGALLLLAAEAHAGRPASLHGCPVVNSIASDTLTGLGSRSLASGHGVAQTIVTADTLIRSVSLWLPANMRLSSNRLHLWITHTDAVGRPAPDRVIADAGRPAECQPAGSRQVRCQFDFVPPIALPARGRYALVAIADACGVLWVDTSTARRPGVGTLWETAGNGCTNQPGAASRRFTGEALAFRVDFCDVGTESSGRTWGEIKTSYR